MSKITETLLIDLRFSNGDFQVTKTGDLAQISGLDNLKQALFHRLITVPGSLAFRPDYGVGIKRWQNNISRIDDQRDLALLIQDQFKQDPRVDEVIAVQTNQDAKNPGLFTILVTVRAIGYNEFTELFDPFDLT